MFTMSPMVNNTNCYADLSNPPPKTKLFFFTASVTMDYDGCTTGIWRLQYNARDAESLSPN